MNLILEVMKETYVEERRMIENDDFYEKAQRLRLLLCYEIFEDEKV